MLFWRNVSETYVDINQVESGPREVYFLSEYNDLDIYLTYNFCPKNTKQLYKDLSRVIGLGFLPPLWALSYQHSRYSFTSTEDVISTDDGYDYHKIPIDAYYLDLFHTGDGIKYFTWNDETFKNPNELIDHFLKKNRWLVTIQDPHIKR